MAKTRNSTEPLESNRSGDVRGILPGGTEEAVSAARLIIAATDKGQVGKSYLFQNLVQWMEDHPRNPGYQAFDLDVGENRTLSLCHQGNPRVRTIALEEDDALDEVVKVLGRSDVDVSIVDGRGGSFESVVLEWAEYSDIFSLGKELGFKITLVLFLAENDELVKQSIRIMESVGALADWLIVKNQKISRTFKLWDEGRGGELAKALGAKEIYVRRLYDNMARYYSKNKVTLLRGAAELKSEVLESRRYLKEWDHIKLSFDAVQEFLLPPAMIRNGQ